MAWQSSLDRGVGRFGDGVGCPAVPLDCHVGAVPLSRNDKRGEVRGRGGSSWFGDILPKSCHCESRKGVAIQSGAWCGMPPGYGVECRPLDCRVGLY